MSKPDEAQPDLALIILSFTVRFTGKVVYNFHSDKNVRTDEHTLVLLCTDATRKTLLLPAKETNKTNSKLR